MTKPKVIAIVGPTAVGKSEVAQIVAETVSGEVVSIDAFQIYRGMDIGTAKVPEEERRVPHHLIDIASIGEEYSVALFQQRARSVIDGLLENDSTPVLAGGSGLYLDAVIDEMNFPEGSLQSSSRKRYEKLLEEKGPSVLFSELIERDPGASNLIEPHNTKRIIRALEVLDKGILYSDQHKGLKQHKPHYSASIFALTMPREELYTRINHRVDVMFKNGLIDEVAALKAEGLAEGITATQAIGYKEVFAYLEGDLNLEDAKEQTKTRSRHYAKRQLSWIARDGRAIPIDMSDKTPESAAASIVESYRDPYN